MAWTILMRLVPPFTFRLWLFLKELDIKILSEKSFDKLIKDWKLQFVFIYFSCRKVRIPRWNISWIRNTRSSLASRRTPLIFREPSSYGLINLSRGAMRSISKWRISQIWGKINNHSSQLTNSLIYSTLSIPINLPDCWHHSKSI